MTPSDELDPKTLPSTNAPSPTLDSDFQPNVIQESRWRAYARVLSKKLKASGVEDTGIVPRSEDVSRASGGVWWSPYERLMYSGSGVSQRLGLPTPIHLVGRVEHQHPYGSSCSIVIHRDAIPCRMLTNQFSEGMLGPGLFGLDLKTSILCIIFFTAASCIPPAYCAINGPRLGMRQMVQARYALGYWAALVCGFLNCLQFIGFMSLTVILGGQSLSLVSQSSMSWTVGIVIVSIISLLVRGQVLALVLTAYGSCHSSVSGRSTISHWHLSQSSSSCSSSLPE